MTEEHRRLEAARNLNTPWRKWGPYLSERQWGTVRGLQPGRQCLGLFQPRPGPLARLSLGRRRPGRHLRRPAAALLCAGAVERPRPDPQGAPVRADQQRGQSRRGRQGILLLPRQHADALVHEVPLQVSAGGFPYADLVETNRRRGRKSRNTSCSTPASSTTTATSTCSSSTPRHAGRHPDPDHRAQPRARGGDASPPADALVPQHLVLGRTATKPPLDAGRQRRRAHVPSSTPRMLELGDALPVLRRRRAAAVHRERDQQSSGSSAGRTRRRTSRTASTTTSCTASRTR